MQKVLDKEQLIEMLESISYQDDFVVTIEENVDIFGKQYFLKIVSEEMNEKEAHQIK